MAVQYKANASTKSGGGGSGSSNKGDKGPIKINLIGYKIIDKVLFQAIGDPIPGKASPFTGKSLTSDPKNELERN